MAKKIITLLLVILMSFSLLTGCSEAPRHAIVSIGRPYAGSDTEAAESRPMYMSAGFDPDRDYRKDPIAFKDIEYLRPDPELFGGKSERIAEAVHTESIDTVLELLEDYFAEYDFYDTMYAVAMVRSYMNSSDEFYSEEFSYCEENAATVDMYTEDLYYACALSDMGPELEREFFWEGFCEEYSDEDDSVFTDEFVALSEQESNVLSRYRDIIAAPTITVDGKDYDYNDYLEETGDYYNGMNAYYDKYGTILSELYVELVQIRKQMAVAAGYDSFPQLQYEFIYGRDYSPEQAQSFCEDVKRFIVPLNSDFINSSTYASIDPGSLSQKNLEESAARIVKRIGGSVEEAYDFMLSNSFYDLSKSNDKVMGSFEVYITQYDSPFLFLNPEGTLADLSTLFHELGHFTSNYVNQGEDEALDVAECYSTALQYMLTLYLEDEFSEADIRNMKLLMVSDILGVFTQQCAFAEFERIVYSMDEDELSPDSLGRTFLALAKDYGFYFPGADWYFLSSWSDITHFFDSPFYVISYAVVNDVAIQFYTTESRQKGEGLEIYERMIDRQSDSFLDILNDIGLQSPFTGGRVEAMAEQIKTIMESVDA